MVVELEEARKVHSNTKSGFLKIESVCVCCGNPVPEGLMVCPICKAEAGKKEVKS